MTTVIVRPNAVHSGSANFSATGAANLHAATSDDSDSSHIRKSGSGTASCIIGVGTTLITNTEMVRRVRLRARVQTPTTAGKLNLQLGTYSYSRILYRGGGQTQQNWFTSAVAIRGLNATAEVVGPWYSTAPNGSNWTQALIDAARIQVTEYRDSADRAYIYELYIDVDKATQPTVTVADPTGTITTTATPVVSWTFTDTESEAQTYYEIKVFDSTAYGAAGFDPSTATTAVWASGQVSSTNNTATVASYLANGTFRAYVRAAKTINGAPFWSPWAYSAFVINVSPPTTPTVVAAWDATLNRTSVTVTGAAAVGYDSQTFALERSIDSGVTWATVRNADALIPNASYVAAVYDYEASRGITVAYRARAVAVLGENTIASTWSSNATAAITNDGMWWFKAIAQPDINASSVKVLDGLDETQLEDVGVFRPIGREAAVVVAGNIFGQDGSYRVVCSGDAEWDAIADIIAHQGTLLVQDPFGTQKYVRLISRKKVTNGAASAARREYDLGYVQVDG